MKSPKKFIVISIFILILTAISMTSISKVPQVQATFPGRNGKIVFQRTFTDKTGETQTQIFIMNPDGSGVSQLTKKGNNMRPHWSSDGKKILFISDRVGYNQIFVMDSDGSHQTRVTHDQMSYDEACLSPDGTKIVCTGLFIMNADGSNFNQLTPFGVAPNWSPDGTKIAFHHCCYDGSGDYYSGWKKQEAGLYIYDMKTFTMIPLFIDVGSCSIHPNWSPDGRKIIFNYGGGSGGISLFMINSDGSELTELTSGWIDYVPCWSPDGKKIAFARGDLDWRVFNIYVMNPDGTGITQLTYGDSVDAFPDWQPRIKR